MNGTLNVVDVGAFKALDLTLTVDDYAGPASLAELVAAQKVRENSVEGRLAKNEAMTNFVVDLRSQSSCPQPTWVTNLLASPQLIWIGLMKFTVVPNAACDAMYIVSSPTRAKAIN